MFVGCLPESWVIPKSSTPRVEYRVHSNSIQRNITVLMTID
jgi:hypothetical protein